MQRDLFIVVPWSILDEWDIGATIAETCSDEKMPCRVWIPKSESKAVSVSREVRHSCRTFATVTWEVEIVIVTCKSIDINTNHVICMPLARHNPTGTVYCSYSSI
jgi:hypothetical protein